MTPEQIENGLRELMAQHELVAVACDVSTPHGVQWRAFRRGDVIRTRNTFSEIQRCWTVDAASQVDFLEYRLRAGA